MAESVFISTTDVLGSQRALSTNWSLCSCCFFLFFFIINFEEWLHALAPSKGKRPLLRGVASSGMQLSCYQTTPALTYEYSRRCLGSSCSDLQLPDSGYMNLNILDWNGLAHKCKSTYLKTQHFLCMQPAYCNMDITVQIAFAVCVQLEPWQRRLCYGCNCICERL